MKLTLDFASSRISIDGDGQELLTVLQMARDIAPSLAKIEIHTLGRATINGTKTPQKQAVSTAQGESNGTATETALATGTTLKQFVRAMRLDNHAERIAAIAYYKKSHENKDSFSPKEMAAWFVNCGCQKPSQMSVAIFSAGNKYDYVQSAGHAKWRITTNGENLVIGKLNDMNEAES